MGVAAWAAMAWIGAAAAGGGEGGAPGNGWMERGEARAGETDRPGAYDRGGLTKEAVPTPVRSVTGTAENISHEMVKDDLGRARRVTRIEFEDGLAAWIEFGHPSVDGFELRPGDEMTITGRPGVVKGKEVLIAEIVRTGGKTHLIQREARGAWPVIRKVESGK